MSITTSIVFKDVDERDYIKRLISVRRNLQGLVENGALTELPDMIQLAMNATNIQSAPASQPRQVFVSDAADKTPGFGVSVNQFLSNVGTPQNISNTKQMFQKIAKQYNEYQQYPWVFSNAWEAVQQMPNPTAEDICCAIEEQISCIDR